MATYQELIDEAETIRTNEVPSSNTANLIGGHLKKTLEFNKSQKENTDKTIEQLSGNISTFKTDVNNKIQQFQTSTTAALSSLETEVGNSLQQNITRAEQIAQENKDAVNKTITDLGHDITNYTALQPIRVLDNKALVNNSIYAVDEQGTTVGIYRANVGDRVWIKGAYTTSKANAASVKLAQSESFNATNVMYVLKDGTGDYDIDVNISDKRYILVCYNTASPASVMIASENISDLYKQSADNKSNIDGIKKIREEKLFAYEDIVPVRILENKILIAANNAVDMNGYNVGVYKVEKGDLIKVVGRNNSTHSSKVSVKLGKQNSFANDNDMQVVSTDAAYDLDIRVENHQYIFICYDNGINPEVKKNVTDTNKLYNNVNTNSEEIKALKSNVSSLIDSTFKKLQLQSYRIVDDRTLINSHAVAESQGQCVELFKVEANDIIAVECSNSSNVNSTVTVQLSNAEGFNASRTWINVSSGNGDFKDEFTVPDTYGFLFVTRDKDKNYSVTKKIPRNEDLAESMTGSNAMQSNAETLTSGENMAIWNFPYCNKKGDFYDFGCNVTSFNSVIISRGYNTYRARWIEITSTKVILWGYESAASKLDEKTHGLNIADFLKVNIQIDDDGTAKVFIGTSTGTYDCEFSKWGYDANGVLKVISNSTLTGCKLSATNKDLRCPVWIFGSSYEGINAARVIGNLKSMGYFDYLINALAGRASTECIADIERAFKFATPKYLFFAIYSNDSDANEQRFRTNLEKLKELCEQKRITLVVKTHASLPNRNFDARNEFVRNLGVRVVDVEKVLRDKSKVWNGNLDVWYNGLLSSDKIHPTALGAKLIAMQYLEDFPEIMQYKDSHFSKAVDDYNGGDNYGG